MGVCRVCRVRRSTVLAAQTQDELKLCSVCFELVETVNLKPHSEENHKGVCSFENILTEILLRPGPGHIEMNMSRLLLNFLWVPFLEELSTSFGFRTQKAKNVFRQGIDHHRSKQLLETLLESLSRELMVPYVRDCLATNVTPSCDGLAEWYDQKVESKNYAFIYHVTFSYLLSFKLYNEAVRKNNSNHMMAARSTFAPLFYCGHHPKYQMLLLRDMCQRVNYTDEVAEYMTKTESHSVSGKNNAGQGADFIHEEVNKEIKSYLPPLGLPSQKTWTNIVRNASKLKQLKNNLLTDSNISFKSEKRSKEYDHEVTMVRRKFRQKGYLTNYFDGSSGLYSLSGESLDHSLCDFNFTATDNYKAYKDDYVETGFYGGKQLPPIFITEDERIKYYSIESQTIAVIKEEILKIIQAMPNRDVALASENDLKSLRYCGTLVALSVISDSHIKLYKIKNYPSHAK